MRSFRVVATFILAAFIASCDVAPPTEAAPDQLTAQVNAGGVAFPVEVFVEAHQDDWELFAGNQTASSIQTAAKVVIVYVTAGDAGTAVALPAYWQARETASRAALDAITAAGDWACANVTLNLHAILRCTKANTVSYYMRLPDGNGEGQGYGFGSLALLRTGGIASLQAVDGTATYASWADLRSTLQTLVAFEAAGQADVDVAVHAHDWDLDLNGSDHSDHRTTGDLLREAAVGRAWNRFWYIGYASLLSPPNLTPAEHDIKWQTIVAYDNVMLALMGETIIGTSHAEEWSERTIYRSELSDGSASPPIPPSAPRAPTNLALAPVPGLAAFDLSWTDNASDEQGFRILRAPDAGGVSGTYVEIASVGANIRTYRNTGLAGATRYWYRVLAYNALGPSGLSNEASSTTPPGPNAPTALVATPRDGTRIDLRWTDNATDEQGFLVERAPDVAGVAGTFVQIASLGPNIVTYGNGGLPNGTRFWYRVRAYNATGNSPYSNVADATTLAPPAMPTNFQAATVSPSVIDLSWNDVATETAYRLQRAPDVGGAPGNWDNFVNLPVNVTTYRVTGLAPTTRYWFRVRADNAIGNSGYTAGASATTMAVIPPSGLTARAYRVGNQTYVDLAWTPGNELTVAIYRNGKRSYSAVVNNGAFTDKLPNSTGSPVRYQICADGFTGASNCSSLVSVTF